MEKMTKTQMFEEIKVVCADREDIVEFCDAQITSLANKAAKAKEKAKAKREEGDELYAIVFECLGSEPMTREDVYAAVCERIENADEVELTIAKVGARITNLVKDNKVVKAVEKRDGKNKTVYTLA